MWISGAVVFHLILCPFTMKMQRKKQLTSRQNIPSLNSCYFFSIITRKGFLLSLLSWKTPPTYVIHIRGNTIHPPCMEGEDIDMYHTGAAIVPASWDNLYLGRLSNAVTKSHFSRSKCFHLSLKPTNARVTPWKLTSTTQPRLPLLHHHYFKCTKN